MRPRCSLRSRFRVRCAFETGSASAFSFAFASASAFARPALESKDRSGLTSKALLRCAIKTELRNSGLAQQ